MRGRGSWWFVLKLLKNRERLETVGIKNHCVGRGNCPWGLAWLFLAIMRRSACHAPGESTALGGWALWGQGSRCCDFLWLPQSWWEGRIWSLCDDCDYRDDWFPQSGVQMHRAEGTPRAICPAFPPFLLFTQWPHWWIFAMSLLLLIRYCTIVDSLFKNLSAFICKRKFKSI